MKYNLNYSLYQQKGKQHVWNSNKMFNEIITTIKTCSHLMNW